MPNTGKGFVSVSATAGRAFGDLNNDGQTDVVIAVIVQWPSGRVQVVTDPAIDRYLVLKEPETDDPRTSACIPRLNDFASSSSTALECLSLKHLAADLRG